MNREQARQEIRSRISCEQYLEKSKSNLYCCPKCGSGTGPNATGAVKYYPNTNTWYCHACKSGGDVIDIYQLETGADYNEALSLMAQELGITIERYRPTAAEEFTPANEAAGGPQSAETETTGPEVSAENKQAQNAVETRTEATADYSEYYKDCRNRLKDPEAAAYLQGRGISLETARAYWLGYDPAADPANDPGRMSATPKPHPAPRIIIPTSRAHYVGRSIDPDTPKAFQKLNAKGSTPSIFNNGALYAQDVQEIFIVEGAFDALSILEAGYISIALNSAGNFNILLKQLEKRRTTATLILCPDNDSDPATADRIKKHFSELAAGLQRLNISHITADINGPEKDANDYLVADKEGFIKALEKAQRQTAAKPDNTTYYIDRLMTGEIELFKNDIKTGFSNLDAQAGGLYPGLYVLAAISSLGKTSFALQLADQLAEAGNDVLFFSLEQSRLELVSKSIARRTVTKDTAGNLQFDNAVTSLGIRKGYLPPQVLAAAEEYKQAAGDRISVIEGNFNCDISFIGDYIRQYIRRNDARPVVFVDYLQILQPAEGQRRQSTKEVIDANITALKRLSRELNITVIAISSVNRANYLQPIDFESLKESGSIEFSADVVWGLQLQCLNDPDFEKEDTTGKRERVKQAKAATPRKIELCCLKNRYGIANYSCYFEYYPANDLFVEQSEPAADFDSMPEISAYF